MMVVYLLALAVSLTTLVALAMRGSRQDGDLLEAAREAQDDGGIGGAEGGAAGAMSGLPSSGRPRPMAFAALGGLGVLGVLGIILRWAAPGLSFSAEVLLAILGAAGFVVIVGAPGRKQSS